MPKVAIVTDTTAYLPDELVDQYQLSVTPQVLIWGEKEFKDGVDIKPDEFYSRLETAEVMPSTSQVTPQSFIEAFTPLVERGHPILAILISDKLSGTIAFAFIYRPWIKGTVKDRRNLFGVSSTISNTAGKVRSAWTLAAQNMTKKPAIRPAHICPLHLATRLATLDSRSSPGCFIYL